MLYTTEEAAVICGFLNAHLAQAGVEVSVRKRNAAFQRGVIMGTLQRMTTDGRRMFSAF